jgi:uncharacterized membrane protein YraQ (UPF0718 family)
MMANLLEAARWSAVMTAELVVLFLALSFLIGLLQARVPEEKIRLMFEKRDRVGAYVGGALLGAITPFCSYSTIPVLAGRLRRTPAVLPSMPSYGLFTELPRETVRKVIRATLRA